tara:strand:+ start:1835 stop:2371 length:537 start_codon:yes stop_codon:yes gene_type:complete
VKSDKIKISFLLSGKGTNLFKILERNLKKEIFHTHSIISENSLSLNLKRLIKINRLKLKTYENTSNLSLNMLKGADIIFSVGYMKLIDQKIIENYKVINLHPSLLPKYKGLMTQKRMLINNEKKFGFTIHNVSPVLDAGEIISQKFSSIKNIGEYDLLKAHKKLEHKYVFKELIKYLN